MHSQLSVLTQKLCEEEKNKKKLLLQQFLQDKVINTHAWIYVAVYNSAIITCRLYNMHVLFNSG